MQNLKDIPLYSKILIAVSLVLVILLAISGLYLSSSLNKINYQEKQPFIESNNKNNNILGEVNNEIEDVDSFTRKNIINILLIGKDNPSEDGSTRSDSIIIATVNKKSKSIKLTSLMRDMYLPIPGYTDNRINEAYALGGMALLTKTIEENFSIEIEGCAEVDFLGFENIIDTMEGVEIELNKDEAYYLSYTSGLNLTEGINSITGKTALTYSRIRYIGNSDYERTERQRNILAAMFDKLKDSGIKTLLELADDIFPLITTNLTSTQILGLITNVITMDVSDIETYRIPAHGEFTETTIRGMSVLLPNMLENKELLKQYIGY